jgi:hypothetical protein
MVATSVSLKLTKAVSVCQKGPGIYYISVATTILWRQDFRALTMYHTVTVRRWFYNACSLLDDVFVSFLIDALKYLFMSMGTRLYLWTAATNWPIVYPLHDIWERRDRVEWYCNKFAGFYFTMEVYYTKSSIHNCWIQFITLLEF